MGVMVWATVCTANPGRYYNRITNRQCCYKHRNRQFVEVLDSEPKFFLKGGGVVTAPWVQNIRLKESLR
jgi:hypothetical protein